jgi:plasmid stability protein
MATLYRDDLRLVQSGEWFSGGSALLQSARVAHTLPARRGWCQDALAVSRDPMTQHVLQTEAMERDAVLNLRVPTHVKEALKVAAAADHGRSMSGMAVRVFREWLTERGYLAPEPETKASTRKGRR